MAGMNRVDKGFIPPYSPFVDLDVIASFFVELSQISACCYNSHFSRNPNVHISWTAATFERLEKYTFFFVSGPLTDVVLRVGRKARF